MQSLRVSFDDLQDIKKNPLESVVHTQNFTTRREKGLILERQLMVPPFKPCFWVKVSF